jgi:hypothetical protein
LAAVEAVLEKSTLVVLAVDLEAAPQSLGQLEGAQHSLRLLLVVLEIRAGLMHPTTEELMARAAEAQVKLEELHPQGIILTTTTELEAQAETELKILLAE